MYGEMGLEFESTVPVNGRGRLGAVTILHVLLPIVPPDSGSESASLILAMAYELAQEQFAIERPFGSFRLARTVNKILVGNKFAGPLECFRLGSACA